ncbi:hypothetical protein [Candidatus Uabimicrobium amorphum]|uniref:ABC transporter permease n=1 Tax=Uabimicrobium amorphum TaxID=2596890 RepID=A0A5S9IU84_UABAM|nr:hypothetical protein [Candidatus Uabimicrobium amorphum]BBM87867.1 ABC transporter permease [Candidatus Uabimicrobium amorphum]
MISKLPLLQKELIEYAATKRLYILRILYGIVVYGAFLLYWSNLTKYSNIVQVLGSGKYLLRNIFHINIITIYLVLPIMSANIITAEKEKRTLLLILITRLGPSFILLEKFLSLVIFMFSFLIMSFPLIYVSYLLGGFTNAEVFLAIYIQLQTVVQIAVIGLLFSCCCRTFLKSLVATYIFTGVLYITLPIFFPLKYYYKKYPFSSWQVVDYTIPIWCLVIALLWIAQYFLRRYPLQRDQRSVPRRGDSSAAIIKTTIANISRPIVWREGTYDNWSLKTKIFFITGIIIGVGMMYNPTHHYRDKLVIIYFLALAIATLFLTIKSATLFQSEIKHQTWDVLLTTTMTTKEIYWQKVMVLTRFTVYLIILLSLYALSTVSASHISSYYQRFSLQKKWIYAITFTCVIFTCIQWSMTWLGLVLRKNPKIAMIAMSILTAWCILPIILARLLNTSSIVLLSPMSVFQGIIAGRIPNYRLVRYDPYIDRGFHFALLFFVIMTAVCFIMAYNSAQKHIRPNE